MAAHPVGLSPAPVKPAGWRKHLTLQNAGILALLLFQAGQLWEGQQLTNAAVASELRAMQDLVKASAIATEATYVRKDVLSVELAAFRDRLASIEAAIRGSK